MVTIGISNIPGPSPLGVPPTQLWLLAGKMPRVLLSGTRGTVTQVGFHSKPTCCCTWTPTPPLASAQIQLASCCEKPLSVPGLPVSAGGTSSGLSVPIMSAVILGWHRGPILPASSHTALQPGAGSWGLAASHSWCSINVCLLSL